MLLEIQSHILSIKNALKNIFLVSISTLFHVGQDLFLNFFSSSSGFVTLTQNKLLKWGAKDASRGAKDASGDGSVTNCRLNDKTGGSDMAYFKLFLRDWAKYQGSIFSTRRSALTNLPCPTSISTIQEMSQLCLTKLPS